MNLKINVCAGHMGESCGKQLRSFAGRREMLNRFFQVIEEYQMIKPGMRIIAGVSGGADSVCLFYVLKQYRRRVPFELMVVHVEHGLRGEESLADAAFVEGLCEADQIPCRVARARVRERMREEGMSCEEAGRAERYRIFEKVCGEWSAQRIAVAHNQNDQAETVLWNLARGSGLRGLGGIRPVQGKIIRPLLFTSRRDIEDCLREAGLTWRTDRTNLETDYTRNRIRLSLLPRMESELNRQAVRHIADAAGRLREVQEYLEERTDEAQKRCVRLENVSGECALPFPWTEASPCRDSAAGGGRPGSGVCLLIEAYKKEEKLIRRELLKRVLQMCRETAGASGGCSDTAADSGVGGMKDIGSVHLEMLEQLADMDCGKSCDLPGGIRAVREEGIVRFTRTRTGKIPGSAVQFAGWENAWNCVAGAGADSAYRTESAYGTMILPVPGCVRYGNFTVVAELTENTPELKKYFSEEKKYTKWLSYDTIKNSLQLRTRRAGDYLAVNAQGGTRKLKDYFIDRKIPRAMRDQIPLLADGSHILWVMGLRISEAAKITDKTKRVLKIQIPEGEDYEGESQDPALGAGGRSEDC